MSMRTSVLISGALLATAWTSHTSAGPSFYASTAIAPSDGTAGRPNYKAAVGHHPTSIALARAIDARLTVRQSPSGKPIHVQHCRTSDGGCRARIVALSRMMTEASNRSGVDPFLTAAIAVRESGLNPLAESPVGARGIVQLNPRYRGKTVPFVYNARYRSACASRPAACQREVVEAGLGLFKWATKRCGGDVAQGLSWYNSGRCDKKNGYSAGVLRERRKLLRVAKDADPVFARVFLD